MQSKERTQLVAAHKGPFLLDVCVLFVWKFLFQMHHQGHKQVEKSLSDNAVVHLMSNSDPVQALLLCDGLLITVLLVWT